MVPDIAAFAALQRDRLRMIAAGETQEGLETVVSIRGKPQETARGSQDVEDPRTSFKLVSGASIDFLKNSKLSLNFNKGRCQDSGTHGHLFIADKSSHHQCGARKKAGKKDTSRGSHELGGCPSKQPLPEAVDWRQSTSSSRPTRCLNKHLRVATSKTRYTNTSTARHLHQQQQQSPQHQLVLYLPNRQALLRPGLSCLHKWIPRTTPHPGPTTIGSRGFGQFLKEFVVALIHVIKGAAPTRTCPKVRASPVNKRLWIKSYYTGVPTYQTWSASASVTVLLLYATMTEVGLIAKSCALSVILLVLLNGELWPRGEQRGSQRGNCHRDQQSGGCHPAQRWRLPSSSGREGGPRRPLGGTAQFLGSAGFASQPHSQ